jgi:23S rRNA pseudouridine2605 synthase/16S rRNA pseudouridine516 synthase
MRLAHAIARSGYTSRRKAEGLIREGLVRVNGRIVTDPATRVRPDEDVIEVAGHRIDPNPPLVYVLLYKPAGVVSTLRDPQGRKTVADLIRPLGVRLFPVGRLDYASEGLLILTNDGDLAFRLTHPRYGCPKTYWVKVRGRPSRAALAQLRAGIWLDGRRRAPLRVAPIRYAPKNTWLEVVLQEGRKNHIRRMFQRVGHPVLKLIRVAIGPIRIGSLRPGQYRFLLPREVDQLRALTSPAATVGSE